MSADGVMRRVKSSQGVSAAGFIGLPPRAGSTTPKIAKKTLPSTGVNVPPPPGGKIAGKTLPKQSPIVGAAVLIKEKKEKDITTTPEKMRKTMSNGSVGGMKPRMKIVKAGGAAGGGAGKVGGIAGKTVPVPGKRAVGVGSASAAGGGGGGGGGGDVEGGVPRKRPKIGGD
ncbi:hypothetical protein L211DRAFT_666093 [Terfezia boudieri ATCC MYA-4762]|uniref:Uncharacterized protein n=1 Tax=Terfezia boudieri ATCC MYA-4762 TaxID=1051890 RepID=A0A3N4L8Z9_9PEZI|nr:hypothetical protein L211DRAFT_666093 [Terfezia boudieri ATCC MYA-4762]